jgi:hypothetical protein
LLLAQLSRQICSPWLDRKYDNVGEFPVGRGGDGEGSEEDAAAVREDERDAVQLQRALGGQGRDSPMGLIHLPNLLVKVFIDNWITCPDKAPFSEHFLL